MKYIVILGDGMADLPVDVLGNKTPLQVAIKPNMDFFAQYGKTGLVKTVPDGIPPGSDPANMSVLGFDPRLYYTGRSPIEAVSMGINLAEQDVAFRCNLVNLSDGEPYENKQMIDYSSDEISTAEAAELIQSVNEIFANNDIQFYPGISYRHCMVWHGSGLTVKCTPPHDIMDQQVLTHLPKDDVLPEQAEVLNKIMKESFAVLSKHKVNLERVKRGLKPANSLWIWGQGKRLYLPAFQEKYQLSGAVISAVDLVKGIGISTGLQSIDVPGATGIIDTNYEGKAMAAVKALKEGADFVYVHIEAPDECGHRQEIENKVKAIEYIDSRLIAVILKEISCFDDYSILVLPDHPTPLSLRTHTSDPVPFAVYTKSKHLENKSCAGYSEAEAAKTRLYIEEGFTLMDKFIGQEF